MLRQGREWKRQNQPVLAKVLADASPSKRAEAVRLFLGQVDRNAAAAQVVLDLDASICSPSARLEMLDRIGLEPSPLEKADAVAVSRALLDSASSDERIVALRNLARFSPGDRPAVAKALRAILRDEPGTFAFGQALDGIVFLRDTEAVPELVDLMKSSAEATAAGATLDRLAAADPLRMAAWLEAHPSALDAYPLLRADYYAKGSVASGENRKWIERYLQRSDLGDEEREKFFFGYLQSGMFLVSGIFTGEARVPPDGPDRAEELRAAAARWEKDPAMRKAVEACRRVLAQIAAEPAEATK